MRKLAIQELNRLSVEEYKRIEKNPVIVILDNIRSANNTGSFFRTADAFAIEALYLCSITARPPHRDIQKTAIGSTESVQWEYFSTTQEAIETLKKSGYQIITIEQCDNSTPLGCYRPPGQQKTAFVFGNEVNGVDQSIINMSDSCLEIPQWGTKHSLNVSVSAGIVLWDHLSKVHSATKEIR